MKVLDSRVSSPIVSQKINQLIENERIRWNVEGAGVNFASLGAHILLWTSGAAGFNNAIVPVIRVSGNKDLYNEDMDIDATGIMYGSESINPVAEKIITKIQEIANGTYTQIAESICTRRVIADSAIFLSKPVK